MAITDTRQWGAYYPLPVAKSNGAYVYNFGYLEGVQSLRKFNVYSCFLAFSSDYPGIAVPPSTRSQHSEVVAAMAAGHNIMIALDPVTSYVAASNGLYYPVRATGADVRAGTWDAMISGLFNYLLTNAITYNVNIVVRPMWEANLGPSGSAFYPGNTGLAAGGTPAPPTGSSVFTTTGNSVITTPQDYKDTFAYLSALLKALTGGSRIKMFYCPGSNDGSAAQAAGNTLATMAPTLATGDFAGYDTYNSIGGPWFTPLQTIAGPRTSDPTYNGGAGTTAYSLLDGIYPVGGGVSIAIGEMNCMDQGDPLDTSNTASGHSKPDWYTDLFALPDSTLPRLSLLAFFDASGTRRTWPFDSSATTLAAFQQAFSGTTTAAGGAVTHGTAAPAYVPPTGTPPLNVYGVVAPFRENYLSGESGLANILNGMTYALNRIAAIDATGWLRGVFNTDATAAGGGGPGVSIWRRAIGETYFASLDIRGAGGALRTAISSRLSTTSVKNAWELREEGTQSYGDGTLDPDLQTGRTGVAAYGVFTPGGTAATLSVSGAIIPNEVDLGNAASTPSAPGVGAGVKLYGAADGLSIRSNGLIFKVKPFQSDKIGTGIYPYAPEAASGTSSALTSGVVFLVRLLVADARTLSRVQLNIVAGGVTLTAGQNFAGIYDLAGNLLGQSADQTTAFASAGNKSITITAVTSLTVGPGYVYAAVLVNGTTGPTMSHAAGLGNFNQAGGANTNYAKYLTAQTALPATLTLASLTPDTGNKWFAVQ